MSLQSSFRQRLEQMEHTRNQRISLLQSEKELHINKSGILELTLSKIRSLEQRCLKLDCKIPSQQLSLSSLKSEIHRLDSIYSEILQKLSICVRALKTDVEELNEVDKEKESYYESERREMENFRAQVETHLAVCEIQVEELRTQVNELGKISALVSLEKSLASNYQLRGQLKKQLQRILANQNQGRK